MNYRIRILILGIAAGVLLVGCASGFTKIAPRPPDKFERLGKVEGSSCGTMLILSTAYNFIPAMLNERVENAYQDALSKAPGAMGLINVTYQENWLWWVIGTTRCTTITGEAVRWES